MKQNIADMRAGLVGESLRGKVLIMAAQIDDLLSDVIDDAPKPANYKPKNWWTFAAKIKFVRELGLMPRLEADALHALREIRNVAAHELKPFSLEVEPQVTNLEKFVSSSLKNDATKKAIEESFSLKKPVQQFVILSLFHVFSLQIMRHKLKTAALQATAENKS